MTGAILSELSFKLTSSQRVTTINPFLGYENIVKLLIDNKADINATNKIGQTPIELAAKNGKLMLAICFFFNLKVYTKVWAVLPNKIFLEIV